MTTTHGRAVAAMALGGLLFGFDTAVIAGATDSLRRVIELDAAGLGGLVSAALWGTLLGAVASGKPGDRWGSRAVLQVVGLFYLASAIGCALATGPLGFAAWRFLGGIAIGATSVLVPVYIAEISPAARRGLLVGLFQLNIVIGILVAYVSNFLIGQIAPDDLAWRWKLGATALPAALFLLFLIGVPQSPRWLASRGRRQDATAAGARLGIALEPEGMAEDREALRWSLHARPIMLAVAIGLLNQLSGINAILYYLNDIFAAAGFDDLGSNAQAIAIGTANLLATMLAMSIVDRVGRKPLLVVGGLVTAVALAGVALVFAGALPGALLLPLLILFIFAFAMSQGAVIWVYLSEIFPAGVRARGQAVGSATHWFANAALSYAFPLVAEMSRAAPFWLFAGAMVFQAILVAAVFPETMRRSLEDISGSLGSRR